MSLYTKLWIGGKYVDAVKQGTFTNYNPATNLPICEVAAGTAEDIDLAVAAAKNCLYGSEWGYASTVSQRATFLRSLGDVLTTNKDAIARMDCLDEGKPLREANGDLDDSITMCGYFATLIEASKVHDKYSTHWDLIQIQF